MSSWSEIRARSGDPLSDSIADLVSRANMAEAITDQITVSDKISHVKILRSKITVTDANVFSAYARPRNPNQKYYMPLEPDGDKVRMDMKFDHGGETLTDYAYMNNQIEIGYDTEQPKLSKNPWDDGITPGELVSTLDGKQHYYRIPRTTNNSIKQMVADGEDGFSLTVRVWYITVVNQNLSSGATRAHICYYIENDQVDYAIKIFMDDQAYLHVYLKMDREHYYLKTTSPQFAVTDLADFDPTNFNPDDFDTGLTEIPIPETIPFLDFAITFDFTTKDLLIYKNGVVVGSGHRVTTLADIPNTTGLSFWFKIDEGTGTNVEDYSGNNLDGTITNLNTSAFWQMDKSLKNTRVTSGGATFLSRSNNILLDALSEYTYCFWVKVENVDNDNNFRYLTNKGWQANGAFVLYRNPNGRTISAEMRDDVGTRPACVMANAFTVNNKWYFVCVRWKSTQPMKMSIDAGTEVNSATIATSTATINSSLHIYAGGVGNDITTKHFMFFKRQITPEEITELYNTFKPMVEYSPPVFEVRPPYPELLHFWYKLDEQTNTEIAYDSSIYKSHIDYSAYPAAEKPTKIIRNGRKELFFDDPASGEYLFTTAVPALASMTKFTLSFFIAVTPDFFTRAHSKVIYTHDGPSSQQLLVYVPSSSRNLNMDVRTSAGTVRFLSLGTNMFTNNNPTGYTTYHVCITYDGTTYQARVNLVAGTANNFTGDTWTTFNSSIRIGNLGALGAYASIMQVMMWPNKVLTLSEITEVYNNFLPIVNSTSSSTTIFPQPWADPDPPPPPGTPTTQPFVNVMNQPTENASVKINKVTTSNLVEVYNVAGGAPESNPFQNKYSVPEGTGSNQTNPYAAPFYNMAGASSTGSMVWGDGEIGYGQYIRTTASALNGKKLTRLTLELNNQGSPTGGTVYLGIIKANGQTIKFGAGIAVSALTNDWTSYTRTGNQDIPTQYTLAVGDGVGVIWEGGTGGTVNIRRTGSNVHQASENGGANSCQAQYVSGVGWDNVNEQWAMAAVMETGGEVVSTTPWITMNKTTNLIVGEQFSNSSLMYNNAPTKLEFKVYKKTGTTGTLTLHIVNSAGATKTNGILKTWNIATELPDTAPAAGVYNLTWENILNTVTVAAGERICLSTPASGTGTMNTGGELYVMSNNNNNAGANNYNGSSSYIVKRNSSGTWATYSTALDISGNIWIGGNDFTGYIHLDDNRKRTGIKADTATSSLVTPEPGKLVTNVEITAKKWNNPAAGAIYCRIRSGAGVLRATIGQKDMSQVLATDTSLEFTNVDNIYTMDTDDVISIEYDGGTATDYLMIRTSKNAFEGTDTILFETLASDLTQTLPVTDRDLAAIVSTGGQIDTAARPRRGIKVNAGSVLIGDPITEARLKLKRTGAFGAGEEMSVKIIRGSDKVTVATLDTKELNTISDTAFVEYIFQNTGNSYPMAEGDFIAIENNFGNSTTSFIEARISSTNAFDGTATCMFEWNGTIYTDVSAADLTAQLFIGGFMTFPDPNVPVDPTPHHYYHGWFIFAATSPDSNAEIDPYYLKPEPLSFSHCMPKQLRLFALVLSPQQLLNYYNNRFTTSPIGYGQTEIVGNDISGYDS